MKITKSELREIIQEVAEEMGLFEGLTAAQEKLPEPLKKAILKKQGKSDDSEEKEDVEEGLTKAQEKLPEPLKKAILKKQGKSDDSEEKEDVEEGLTKAQEKLPEPLKKAILKKQGKSDDSSDEEDVEESIKEGNAFGAAVKAARENGDSEFEVGGKTYQLKEKVTEEVDETEEFTGEVEEDCEECNEEIEESSCGTHEEDEDDVEEGNAFGAAVKKAKEDGETEFEVDGKTYKVRENWSKVTLAEKLERMLGNKQVL